MALRLIKNQACLALARLSKSTFLSYLEGPTKEYYLSLDEDSWSIVSFDPISREVCVDVTSKFNIVRLSTTISPYVISDSIPAD